MKSSYNLSVNDKYRHISKFDKIEIDNPKKYHPRRLHYINRINRILFLVRKYIAKKERCKIADFACAQGNIAMLLAEEGYKVFAVDINPYFIEYAKLKHEKGNVQWNVSNIDDLNFLENTFNCIIAGELIEHCAYPEDIVDKMVNFIRFGGFLILTTPNGSRILSKLPTFSTFRSKKKRRIFEEKQFGPDGDDHLFLFKMDELDYIVPEGGEIIEKGYTGGSIFINKYSILVLKYIPHYILEHINEYLTKIPIINSKMCNNIYIIIKKSKKNTND